jgi:protein-tyrosine phosphatase
MRSFVRLDYGPLLRAATGIVAVSMLGLAGCAPSQVRSDAGSAQIVSAKLERTADGRYRATWQATRPGAAVDVRLATTPDATPAKARLVSRADRDGVHEFAAPAGQRPYVLLQTRGSRPMTIAERILPLEGGRNFRDLGGYATNDGRRVRWGRLFRSGSMASLTESDYRYLGQLGIRTVCDFRSNSERNVEPTLWKATPVAEIVTWDYDMASQAGEFVKLIRAGITAERMNAVMAGFYGNLPYEYSERYRRMFAELVAGSVPLAFNCSAGKDRTGVAAALILSALGVPRDVVIEDYMLSNVYLPPESGAKAVAAMGMPMEIAKLLGGVERSWIETTLATLEKQDGSIESYLDRRLGVGPTEIARLRSLYLE